MTVHRLTDRIAVSDAPSEDELRTAAREGYRTIIDLRADGEPHPGASRRGRKRSSRPKSVSPIDRYPWSRRVSPIGSVT